MAQKAPSSTFTCRYTYDVFLNFKGEDTRTGFTGNLYNSLCQRGVLTFIDDQGLRRGEEITPALLKAIEESRLAIIIFSRNYATSTFCLNELVNILECIKAKGRWVWPVFYDVDPSEVRYQTGSYGKALAMHEEKFKDCKDKVQKWRLALYEAANLSGWHFKHGDEYEHVFIGRIIEEVSCKINRRLLHIANHPVGLEARMLEVQSLLNDEFDNEVNMLGIYGIGGMGKSTIARTLYNLIADQFEGSCFLADVREKSTKHGLVQLQETLLFELVGERNIKLGDVNQGIPILKTRLHNKKVLVILDDVDKMEQLQAIAGELDWFGAGSIIIITTRDKRLLDIHGVERKYEVNELNDTEALELFRWNAFKKKEVDPSYTQIIKRAIHYARGLPLVLETIGSNLYGKTLDEWISALDAYERIPNRNVQEILRVSYDGLEENEKEIFLDIACFFKRCTLRYVTNMLYARGFHPKYGIRVLAEKSLIKILRYDDDYVTMHDLIQYMGKEIVRQESPFEPDKRSRLWFYEDIVRVLEKNTDIDKVEAMMLDMPKDKEVHWNQKAFGKMKNLKMLIIKNACFYRSPKHLPNSLRVLEWWGYPSTSLPSNFHSKNLVILNLSYSCFQWDKPLKKSEHLTHMIFRGCEYIRKIPDVSGFPNLTELCVDYGTNLIEIHDSVGFLDKLRRLSAEGCTKLRVVPRGIKLTSLEYLSLRDCTSLEIFSEILEPMVKLKFVDLKGTAIENLPFLMRNLRGLGDSSMNKGRGLDDLISNATPMLPNIFPYLEILNLSGTSLTILPACLNECRFLRALHLTNCKQLREIRGIPPNVQEFWADNCTSLSPHCSILRNFLGQAFQDPTELKFFTLPGQRIPEWFDLSSKGDSVCFWFRKKFPAIIVCAAVGVVDIRWPIDISLSFSVQINGTKQLRTLFSFGFSCETNHICMCTIELKDLVGGERLLLEHGWNHAEVLCVKYIEPDCHGSITWTGVHVNRECTSMEDVRFIDPNPPKRTCDNSSYINHDLHLSCSPSLRNQCTLLDKGVCENVEPQGKHVAVYDEGSDWLLKSPFWKQPLYYEQSDSDSTESSWTIGSISDQDRPLIGESFQVPDFLDTPNIQAPSPASSYVSVTGGEQHLRTSSTVLPTTIDESLRIQAELTQDDVETETFYASPDADTSVLPSSRDELANTAPSEEAKEALKTLQDFISYDASILSADGGISGKMRSLISEASRLFSNLSRYYNKASGKTESTTSEPLRADELEAGLEAIKNQFRKVMALEIQLRDNLAYMGESIKDLEEHINAIKAKTSTASDELSVNTVAWKKREHFEEAKTLKAQRDELREQAPRLRDKQDLAKKIQANIRAEWSKLKRNVRRLLGSEI